MSGVYGGLIGSASAILVFAGIEFSFPSADTFTIDLNNDESITLKTTPIRTPCGSDNCEVPTIELVGKVEVSPGICRYEWMNSEGPTFIVETRSCQIF